MQEVTLRSHFTLKFGWEKDKNNKLLAPVVASNDIKAALKEVLKQIRWNCKGELCTFFQHATAYNKQLGLNLFVHGAT